VVLGLGITDKVGVGGDSALSQTPNQANKRRPQRYSLYKTPGHKRNRCPGRSE
jgi:hypothetical protein